MEDPQTDQQEEISKLLNTHDQPNTKTAKRQEYKERIRNNQIIRGWNCYVDGGDPTEDSGFEVDTDLHKMFRRGYNEAEMWHKGWSKPQHQHSDELLDKRIAACSRTIRQCVEHLSAG